MWCLMAARACAPLIHNRAQPAPAPAPPPAPAPAPAHAPAPAPAHAPAPVGAVARHAALVHSHSNSGGGGNAQHRVPVRALSPPASLAALHVSPPAFMLTPCFRTDQHQELEARRSGRRYTRHAPWFCFWICSGFCAVFAPYVCFIVARQFPSIVNMLECMNFIKDSQRVTRPKP
jgi:hypothetical protein